MRGNDSLNYKFFRVFSDKKNTSNRIFLFHQVASKSTLPMFSFGIRSIIIATILILSSVGVFGLSSERIGIENTSLSSEPNDACINSLNGNLVINEIHYNPDKEELFNPIINALDTVDGKNFEFIELKNVGGTLITLNGVVFTEGVSLILTTPIDIPAGGFAVFADDAFWFEQKYGFAPDAQYTGKLDNEGEQIVLFNSLGNLIDTVDYKDGGLWDAQPSNGKYTLELLYPDLDNSIGLNWFRSDTPGGTPKAENSRICNATATAIVINEINYNSNNGVLDPGNWIELYNPNSTNVDLSNWTLYDEDADFILPTNTTINANSYLVLVEDITAFQAAFPSVAATMIIGNIAGLSKKGERLSLFDANKCLSDYVDYNDKLPWSEEPNGTGTTLALNDVTLDNAEATSWSSSSALTASFVFGSPGASNTMTSACLVGYPCEDGDPCTTGEKYDANCNCVNGSFTDDDNDGVCNANDICGILDDALILQPCDDENPNTIFDHYSPKACACKGLQQQATYCVQIQGDSDDMEEYVGIGSTDDSSSDLEFTQEKAQQIIGLRFEDIPIPHGGIIQSANIQFTADEINTEVTNLIIKAENTDDAKGFEIIDFPVSSRVTTNALVNWQPPAWNIIGERSASQQTPDLSTIIQEVIDRPDFEEGNELAFIISGTGLRVAVSHEGNAIEAAELCITYSEGNCVVGLACDDGNAQTINDAYDTNCNCVGQENVLYAKLFLEGFYQETQQQMHTQLKEKNLLPLTQPFSTAPWNYAGTESVTSIPDNITDWVLVISRSVDGTPLSRSVGFISQSGELLAIDGSTGIVLDQVDGNYFSVHHRSHLAIVSSQPYTGALYDFTFNATQAKGINQQKSKAGIFVLYAGDYDANGIINSIDFNNWKIQGAVLNQYLSIDGDGNGIVNNLDYNLWVNNRSKVGEISIRY